VRLVARRQCGDGSMPPPRRQVSLEIVMLGNDEKTFDYVSRNQGRQPRPLKSVVGVAISGRSDNWNWPTVPVRGLR
jgi:hypothetical protein